jgi:hypothetical protein
MSTLVLLIAAVAMVPAFGLAAWVWHTSTRVDDDLRTFAGFEGLHLES